MQQSAHIYLRISLQIILNSVYKIEKLDIKIKYYRIKQVIKNLLALFL
jgi:hypothetical protein